MKLSIRRMFIVLLKFALLYMVILSKGIILPLLFLLVYTALFSDFDISYDDRKGWLDNYGKYKE